MKLFFLGSFIFLLLISPGFAQSSLTSGTISATNPTLTPCPSGAIRTFNYIGKNTEINGIASPAFSGAMMSECYGDACCMYGRGFLIRDVFSGNNNFRYVSGPVIVNGVSYTSIFFRGSLNVNGFIRVPFHLRKKASFTYSTKVTLTGHLNLYLTMTDVNLNNPFYSKTISDSGATATVTIAPRNGNPLRFDVTNLVYEFVNAN